MQHEIVPFRTRLNTETGSTPSTSRGTAIPIRGRIPTATGRKAEARPDRIPPPSAPRSARFDYPKPKPQPTQNDADPADGADVGDPYPDSDPGGTSGTDGDSPGVVATKHDRSLAENMIRIEPGIETVKKTSSRSKTPPSEIRRSRRWCAQSGISIFVGANIEPAALLGGGNRCGSEFNVTGGCTCPFGIPEADARRSKANRAPSRLEGQSSWSSCAAPGHRDRGRGRLRQRGII